MIDPCDLDASRKSAQAMLENYKDQGVSVDRGFRFLKDPIFFVHSQFLKKPERLMYSLSDSLPRVSLTSLSGV